MKDCPKCGQLSKILNHHAIDGKKILTTKSGNENENRLLWDSISSCYQWWEPLTKYSLTYEQQGTIDRFLENHAKGLQGNMENKLKNIDARYGDSYIEEMKEQQKQLLEDAWNKIQAFSDEGFAWD